MSHNQQQSFSLFWRAFAVVLGAGALYVAYTAVTRFDSGAKFTITNEQRLERMLSWEQLTQVTNAQLKPSMIVLKDKAGSVEGYVSDVDGEFLVLATAFPEKSMERRVFIPISNIEYVQFELKLEKTSAKRD